LGVGTNSPNNRVEITHGTAGNSGLRLTNLPSAGTLGTNSNGDVIEGAAAGYGDVKLGMQGTDHNGWILLDGRATATLTASQQARATSLGFGANLPNATDAMLTQNGTALGSRTGSNTKTIAQNQLPNVTLGGSTSSNSAGTPSGWLSTNGHHGHGHNAPGGPGNWGLIYSNGTATTPDWDNSGGEPNLLMSTGGLSIYGAGDHSHSFSGNALGGHSHSITTNSINGGVAQQALNVQPLMLSTNMFMYLGV
jgi:hypothetical protein